jgi:hypothetical protein
MLPNVAAKKARPATPNNYEIQAIIPLVATKYTKYIKSIKSIVYRV